RVAPLADVDERGLHGGQHVLHLAEVHVADVRLVAGLVHVVLDQRAVLKDRDLGPVAALADHHDPLDRLTAGQELRLGDDRRAAPAGLPALAPTLPLGFQPGRALDRPDVRHVGGRAPGRAHVGNRVRRVVGRGLGALAAGAAATPTPTSTAAGRTLVAFVTGRLGLTGRGRLLGAALGRGAVGLGSGVGSVLAAVAGLAVTATAAATPPRSGLAVLLGLVGGLLLAVTGGVGRLGRQDLVLGLVLAAPAPLAGAGGPGRLEVRGLEHDHRGLERGRRNPGPGHGRAAGRGGGLPRNHEASAERCGVAALGHPGRERRAGSERRATLTLPGDPSRWGG